MQSVRIPDFLNDSAPDAARQLLGWGFYVRENDGSLTGGVIIETEAYTSDDEASHSFKGKTARNGAMFDKAGTMYVYFTYGMHWCCNIVTGPSGRGEAVLIRALAPLHGIDTMQSRRNITGIQHLCDGPAKLCQSLGITGIENGRPIDGRRFLLMPPKNSISQKRVVTTPRIGIRREQARQWRFVLM